MRWRGTCGWLSLGVLARGSLSFLSPFLCPFVSSFALESCPASRLEIRPTSSVNAISSHEESTSIVCTRFGDASYPATCPSGPNPGPIALHHADKRTLESESRSGFPHSPPCNSASNHGSGTPSRWESSSLGCACNPQTSPRIDTPFARGAIRDDPNAC